MQITVNGNEQEVSNVEEIVAVLGELSRYDVSYDGPTRTVSISAMSHGKYFDGHIDATIVVEDDDDLGEVEGALEDSCSAMVILDGDIEGGEFRFMV